MNSANCSGVLVRDSMPDAASLSRRSGEARALTISAFSRPISSRGVPDGASMPYQIGTSKPCTPDSAAVGTFGRLGTRFSDSSAIPFTLPAVTCGAAMAAAMMSMSVSPDIRPTSACPEPLYGTCTVRIFIRLFSSSAARWPVVPTPPEL